MVFKKIKPSDKLHPYINCYYLLEGEFVEPSYDIFFPDGCVEVVFNIGWDFCRNEEIEPWAKVIGQITKPLKIKVEGKGKSFGIWFYPHTFSAFSDVPIVEFNDKVVHLENIFSTEFIHFVEECLHSNELKKLIEKVDCYLINTLRKSKNELKDKVANYAINTVLKYNGEIDLNNIAFDCNISSRYLQKIFLEKVGFSPRYFTRILRFKQVLNILNTPSKPPLTAIGYQAGYFDQAHFIREFKEFTGFTPSKYQMANHPINQYFLNLPKCNNKTCSFSYNFTFYSLFNFA
jgi:AraC-like DNA-binding protein